MITVSGLTKSYGARVLFRDVTFQVSDGRRIALVGGNGAGKTTLLEIVLGTTEADGGEVHRPKDLTVGYLPQEITEWRDGSVLDEVLAGRPEVQELEQRLVRLHDDLATTSGVAHDRALAAFGEAQSRFEAIGGYAVEADAHRVLAGLGFAPSDAARPLTDMSGGWRMRAALGRLLLAQPEVLILDEPTNHLDTDSVTWLEDTLSSYAGAVLFVSHDRDFIDAVAERVIELAAGTATEYVGGFAEFVVQREERLARLRSQADRQARDIAHIERFVERFRYKATKARQVQSRIKTLEKLDRIEVPDHRTRVARFGFPPPQRSSRLVAELVDVTVGYDGVAVLSAVDFAVERGEKVALVGPDGAGKTTLLRLLAGVEKPDTGEVMPGHGLRLGYYAQEHETLDTERSLIENMHTAAPDMTDTDQRKVLGSFLFSGDDVDKPVGVLSGGEKTRLALALLVVSGANVLLLDEPTNNLDPASREEILAALATFRGAIVLVTHDEGAVDALSPERVIVLPEGTEDTWSADFADLVALA